MRPTKGAMEPFPTSPRVDPVAEIQALGERIGAAMAAVDMSLPIGDPYDPNDLLGHDPYEVACAVREQFAPYDRDLLGEATDFAELMAGHVGQYVTSWIRAVLAADRFDEHQRSVDDELRTIIDGPP